MAGLLDLLSQTWPSRLVQGAWDALKLPGDAYAGRATPNDPGYYNRAASLAGLMTAMPGTPAGALGSSMRLSGMRSPIIENTTPLLRPANLNSAPLKRLTADDLPPPLSTIDRTVQNYHHVLTPDEVIHSEPVWGSVPQLAAEKGISESEAFSQLANAMWSRQGANRYISPEQAKTFMRMQRGKASGIQALPDLQS